MSLGTEARSGAGSGAGTWRAGRGAPVAPLPPARPGRSGGPPARSPRPSVAESGAGTDAREVVARLEEAGRTLLALPRTGPSPALRASVWEVVHAASEAYGWQPARLRPPVPDAARISRMDEALGWIRLIPPERYVLRRIVGARALVHPLTERHLYPWRRLGAALGADHKAVQRWHAQAIDLIVAALNGGGGEAALPGASLAAMMRVRGGP
jgi:hypothetical protein